MKSRREQEKNDKPADPAKHRGSWHTYHRTDIDRDILIYVPSKEEDEDDPI